MSRQETEVIELPEPLGIGLYRLSPEQPISIKVDLEGKTVFVPLTQSRLLKLIAEGAHLMWATVGR